MKICLTGGKRTKVSGFTLMEMLIVVALFSMVMVVITQTFTSFNQLHRKIANRAVLSQDLRFTMELLVRAARNRPMSYANAPIAARSSELRLSQDDGTEMVFRRSDVGDARCGDLATVACLLLSTDGGSTWVPITGKRVHVERFDVYVRPSVSPFVLSGSSYPNATQPFVTFSLRMRYMAEREKEQETLEAQTTVSSRVYLR
jgi:prepilin-type N-terminal cleavage/methylation domain-containing protein